MTQSTEKIFHEISITFSCYAPFNEHLIRHKCQSKAFSKIFYLFWMYIRQNIAVILSINVSIKSNQLAEGFSTLLHLFVSPYLRKWQ